VDRTNSSTRTSGVRWKLQKSGSFSLKSLYRFITFGGVVDIEAVDVWNTKLPLKIQILIWMLVRDRLQSATQLVRRNWDGSELCNLCGERETADHIFFRCPMAIWAWCWVRDSLEWSGNPTGVCDFVEKKLLEAGKQEKHLMIFLLAGVAWSLWKTRNDWDF
jgi:hypothetical protein